RAEWQVGLGAFRNDKDPDETGITCAGVHNAIECEARRFLLYSHASLCDSMCNINPLRRTQSGCIVWKEIHKWTEKARPIHHRMPPASHLLQGGRQQLDAFSLRVRSLSRPSAP